MATRLCRSEECRTRPCDVRQLLVHAARSATSANRLTASIYSGPARHQGNIAFVPLAMPLMFGPGAIATVLGMTSKIRQSSNAGRIDCIAWVEVRARIARAEHG